MVHPSSKLMPVLMPIEQALEYLLTQLDANISRQSETIVVPLSKALGGILAQDQTARIDVPGHNNSAMDGYAVNCKDLFESDMTLPISQTIAAGHLGKDLSPKTAARIFTGAAIPKGADAVIIQENTSSENNYVSVLETTSIDALLGQNIRLKGHDIQKGEMVLSAGYRLRPQDMGLLSSLGISEVSIKKPLKVAIINTGDEIVPPQAELAPGQIYDSNSFTLNALLQSLGFETIKIGIVGDDFEETKEALKEAASLADCIITTGGVSVGDEDHVKAAVKSLGELSLWKLAIKPGKPFSYGNLHGRPFFGLPGNPVAVFVTFCMLVRPYLLKMQGAQNIACKQFKVKSGFSATTSGSRQEYIRVRLEQSANGEQELTLFANQGSSIMTSLSWANGLAVVPINTAIARGDLLDYIPFTELN